MSYPNQCIPRLFGFDVYDLRYWDNFRIRIQGSEGKLVNASPADYVTLRLDIRGMSKLKTKYFGRQYNSDFESLMKETTVELMRCMNAKMAFTQSDEITLLLCPVQIPGFHHLFAGRRDKLVSMSAAVASAIASRKFEKLLAKQQSECKWSEENPTPILTFDSRMAVWESFFFASAVIQWRMRDCAINGVSDAIMEVDAKSVGLPTLEKFKILDSHGKLPLPKHQMYGTLFRRFKKIKEFIVPAGKHAGKQITTERSVIEEIDGSELSSLKQ